MSVSQEILDSVVILLKEYAKNIPFDKVRSGRIEEVEGNNLYSVLVDNRLLSKVPCLNSVPLSKNDIVKIMFPENQTSNVFILGKL